MLLGSRGYTHLGERPLRCANAIIRVTAGRERGTTRVQRPMPLIGFRPHGRTGRRCGSLHPGPFSTNGKMKIFNFPFSILISSSVPLLPSGFAL